MIRTFLLLFLSVIGLEIIAQPVEKDKIVRNYFRNPLDIPMQLSANFGELRPNHWHMGLDIRTNAKENLHVYAAAEGYIAKVGIRPQSFGRFIIINHPNGLSTLYAHLNDFYAELEQYITEQQYKQESWAVELNFTEKQFPLSKGVFIAYSGNTGGSRGPHLHFEIFDTKSDKRLNPLLFNFPLQDNLPPVLFRLAMYDRSKSIYSQTPLFFPVKNTDSGYIIPKQQLIKTGLDKISFAIQANDRMGGGGSDNGIFSAKLYLDDEPQISFVLDSIDYVETVYMNAHIDYRYDYNGGAYLQQLSQLPGDRSSVYKQLKNDGVINLLDTTVHLISIDVKDAQGNTSQLNFAIQHDDSIDVNNSYSMEPKLIPAMENKLRKSGFEVNMPETCLYDSVPLVYGNSSYTGYNAASDGHQFGNPVYPVHGLFTVRLRPNKVISKEAENKLVITQSGGKRNAIKKATLQDGWITAEMGNFGNFQAYMDFSPPVINSLGNGDTINLSSSSRIIFTPTDNFGIKKFSVAIYLCPSDSTGFLCDSVVDYKWLRFTNDKSRNWIYKFDSRVPYGLYKLKATAEDLVGNTTIREWWIKRMPYKAPPPKKKVVKKVAEKTKKAAEKKKKEASKKTATGTSKKKGTTQKK